MGEVSAVTLWIVVGVIALGALGLVCSWVLRARGGLDAMYQIDPDRAARDEVDAQLHAMQVRDRSSGGAGFGGF
jgi:tRNA A37 threonylcarbamoyladenosine dehydratase